MGEILMVSTIVENSRGLLIDTVATDSEVAKKAGNNTQTFKVADAVNPDEAMALGQLTKANIDQLLIDANTVDGVQGALLGIGGAGYSWVDETANRVAGTTYTNIAGKPKVLSIQIDENQNSAIEINGIDVSRTDLAGTSGQYITLTAIVPHTAAYYLRASTLLYWAELK